MKRVIKRAMGGEASGKEMVELLQEALGPMTQAQVADLLGVTQPTVSDWLKGNKLMTRPVQYLVLAHLGWFRDKGEWVEGE